ncbi:MAG: apolipoprotein N-acyltransferase [Bacteroidales bacterium]
MNKKYLLLLSLISALLLSLAWPANGFPLLLFIALIPLLFIEDELCDNKEKYHTYHILFFVYPGFFTWNLLTTWWIYNSTAFGVTMAVLFNSLFMSVVFLLYHWTKKRFFGRGKGYFILAVYWISFEFFHQEWDLSWSWLNLGNGFASWPSWIQWYEYTGIFGGTLWVIAANIAGYKVLTRLLQKSNSGMWLKPSLAFGFIVLVPLLISWWMFTRYEQKKDPVRVVVVQPNIDPYKEQYSLPPEVVMDRIFTLAEKAVDTATNLLVCPESAIQEDIWENEGLFEQSPSIQNIHQYTRRHPGLAVVMGASTFKRFMPGEKVEETARYFKQKDFWYNAYNTAIFTDSTREHQLYHKSMLVVGVERMPFPKYLKFLEKYALDLGGTIGTLGISPDRTVFRTANEKLRLGTAICYESVYGEFFSKFVRNGATLMLIITNDGWWGDSPGHKQHLRFASLRAIENRRCIARSANTGISCFVDQRGVIHDATAYWQPAVISGNPDLNEDLTFYTRNGDIIARISYWVALLLIVASITLKEKKK